ncbi:hypothetical protein LTR15_012462 [Elasticomyces elasticus]|nr:hypothetical protein LTR15_012462 [Elasticomyces elasticus]
MATNITAPQSDDQPPSADLLLTVVPPSQRKQIQEIAQLINNLNASVRSAMLAYEPIPHRRPQCNIEPMVPFIKNLQKYFKIPRDQIRKPEVGLVKISLRGVPNWPNLMKWIRLSYDREISWWFLVDINTVYRDKKRVWNVFTTARKMKMAGLPWETARSILRTLRANLKEADPRW